MSATSRQEILCAPEGLLPAEREVYWRDLAQQMYGTLKLIVKASDGNSIRLSYVANQAREVLIKAEGYGRG